MTESVDAPSAGNGIKPRFPATVWAAGVIWITAACLSFAVGLIGTLAIVEGNAKTAEKVKPADGSDATAGVFVLFGAVFLFIGVRSLKGTAPRTVTYGWLSIVFGLGWAGLGLAAHPASVLDMAVGVCLFAAGMLALAGDDAYRSWQKGQ
jgi:hypothetical protein